MKIEVYNAQGGILSFVEHKFDFHYTQTIATDVQPGAVTIYGLSEDTRNRLESVAKPREGKDLFKRLSFYDDEHGQFYRSHLQPPTVKEKQAVKEAEKDGKVEPVVEKVKVEFHPIGWAKCAIYDDDGEVLYRGDVISIFHTGEYTELTLGTAYYFFNMPYGQRLIEGMQDKAFALSRLVGTYAGDAPGLVSDPYSYMKVSEQITQQLVDMDPYGETGLAVQTSDFDPENKYYLEALEKLIKEGNLNVTDPYYIGERKGKKENRPAYMILRGTIQEVLKKLSDTGLFNHFCLNDCFYLLNYFKADNDEGLYKVETRTAAGQRPGEFPVTEFTIRDDRASFQAGYGLLLRPAHGVVVIDRGYAPEGDPPARDYELYIDTVNVTGNERGYNTTYSGRLNNFLWRDQ